MARYDIYSGIISNGLTLSSGTSMYISSGGTANNTTVNSRGSMYLYSGGTANNTTVNSRGSMYLYSGGTANNTTINSGGSMYLSSGATANSITVNSSGTLHISSGATATNIVWSPFVGTISAYNGAYVTYATQYSGVYWGSRNSLFSHTTIMENKIVSNSAIMYVMNNGVANSTIINNGNMYIAKGGVANNTTMSYGDIVISSGGIANKTTVTSRGYIYISNGGVVNSATISGGGSICVSSGGVAKNIVNEAYIWVFAGGTAQDITNNMTIYCQYGKMYNTINNGGISFYGGHAYETIVNGTIWISGGIVDYSTINSGGIIYVNGGCAINTNVNYGGTIVVSSRASASIIYNPWSGNIANNGGSITYLDRDAAVYYGCATLGIVSKADTISELQITSGNSAIVYNDGTVNDTYVDSNGYICISSGGVANCTTVNSIGNTCIYSGGTANSTIVNSDGGMFIYSGGTANSTIVNSDGRMFIYSGGTANSTTVNSIGSMCISSGGTATNIIAESGAHLNFTVAWNTYIQGNYASSAFEIKNAYISDFTVNSGSYITISSGATAREIVENGGFVYVGQGANVTFASNTIKNIVLFSQGMTVHKNTIANNTTVNGGWLNIYSGGVVNSTTVNSDGKMMISSGGSHCGSLQIESKGIVSAYQGSVINFTVSERTIPDEYLINNLSLIKGAPTYTITISVDQENGTYKLAQGAGNFTGTLTIGDGTVDYGIITVNGDDFVYNDTIYSLDQVDGNLTLTIEAADIIPPELTVFGDITTSTNKDVTLTLSANEDCEILYQINNGDWNTYIDGITLSDNGTVNIKATDISGNITEKSIDVTNIDKVAPTLEISGNATKPTNQDVVLTATASDGTIEYFADGKWNVGNSITAIENGTFKFRVTDEAGNVTEKSVVVDTIDKVAPTLSISGNATVPTNQDVVLTATASDGKIEYYDGKTWVAGNKLTVTDNGTYKFRVTDEAGNVTEKSVVVDQIDKIAPILEISGNVETPTNQDVVLTATASDGTVEYYDGTEWIEGNKLTVSENGTYQFRVTDAAGNITEKSVTVDMIDKVAPTLEISGNVDTPTNEDVVLTATASDGIVEYFTNGKWNIGNSLTVTTNGTYQFRVTDAAGNITEKSVTIDMIDKVAPTLEISGNATAPTNQDVVLTATASDGTIEYFADGKWNVGSSLTVTTNGTYQFRVTDEAGNVTEKSVTVDMIDKVAPNKPSVFADVTTATNGNVTVSATFSSDTVVKQYSFDNKTWKTYSSSVVMENNGTVYFRGKDEAGNYSAVTSYEVTNIDKVAPTLSISGNATVPTNKDVVLTATASDGTIEYFANGKWNKGNSIAATENGTYMFRVTDTAGNVTEKLVVVDMIDKVAPTLNISGNVTVPTNKDIVLTATASDGTIEYYDGKTWIAGDKLTVRTNGTYKFHVTDAAGNITEKSVEVTMIDKVAPNKPSAFADVTTATNGNVTVSATFSSDSVVKEYSLDNKSWKTYTSGITFEQNGTVYFRGKDEAGNYSAVTSYEVTNIDKVAPILSISGNATEPTNKDIVLAATASDGTIEYFANGKWNIGSSIIANENGTYKFRVTDVAGNVTEKSVIVNMIDKVAPTLEISGNATVLTNQDVVLTAIASDGKIEYYDGKDWIEGNKLIVSANGTYQFRVTDAAGNVTEKSVVVDMIDKVAPTLEISGNVKAPTNKDVVLTATASDGTVEYFADGKWHVGNSITATANGSYCFRVTDAAGNVTEKSVTVDMIDKVAPTLEISGNATAPTNKDVVLIATASDGTVEYFANDKWNIGSSLTVTTNGTYQFRVTDAAGNVTEKSVVVDMIDKVAPNKPSVFADVTTATNGNVTVSATFSSDTVVKEYSLDNKSWKTYTSGITFEQNGTVYFRGKDEAGNYSAVTSYEVTNIDKVAPTLSISGNATAPTNKDVVLTATASDGTIEYFANGKWNKGNSITATENGTYMFRVTDTAGNVTEKSVVVDMIDKVAPTLSINGNATVPTNQDVVLTATASDGTIEYFDNGKWNKGNTITASENGTFKFRVTDTAGNVTEKSVTVDMIDKVAPTLEISGNVDSPTNKDVVLTATASDGTIEYFADGKWNKGNSITASENGTYQFRVTDAAGNVTKKSITVDMIDKIAPTLKVMGNVTKPTNKNVMLLAIANDGIIEYWDGTCWSEGDSLLATDNGTYKFRVTDMAGNVTEETVVVDMIDKIAPSKPVASADVTSETKDPVTVSAAFSNDSAVKQYSLDNKTWYNYTSGVVMESHGTVYFRGIDAAGNISAVASYEVNNIVAASDIRDNDLDGNGLADVILVHTKQGYSGAWLSTGTNSVIKWGSLSNIKSGTEILGTGKLVGSADDGQDIFFKEGKTVGAWNVVDGKVTGYKTIMSVNATTNVIGLGDFSGDGATDLLLRSTSGDLGFYGTDGTGWEYLIGLGKEWSVAAVGDLNGDGLADTIVRHDAGFAGTFLTQTDGTVKWANLDTLAKDMTIVGTGDFNGDGVDDVLLQKSNGWIGVWLVEDGSVDGFMGICTNKSAIEQIADFNGDGIDDLRVRDGKAVGVLYVNGADSTTWQYFQSVGTEWDTSFSALA